MCVCVPCLWVCPYTGVVYCLDNVQQCVLPTNLRILQRSLYTISMCVCVCEYVWQCCTCLCMRPDYNNNNFYVVCVLCALPCWNTNTFASRRCCSTSAVILLPLRYLSAAVSDASCGNIQLFVFIFKLYGCCCSCCFCCFLQWHLLHSTLFT